MERLPDEPLSAEEPQPEAENEHPEKKWYVIHTYAGYENRVERNLLRRVESGNDGSRVRHETEFPTGGTADNSNQSPHDTP